MSRKPGYAEIAAHYRQLIADGTLAPGDSMPSMRKVMEEFNVSITTANRAFRQLKTEGLTVVSPGNRTVVTERPREAVTAAARLGRISRTGRLYGSNEKSVQHQVLVRPCTDPMIADLLDVELHEEIVIRIRVFQRNDVPTSVGFSYIHMRAIIDVPELLDPKPFKRFWQEIYTERTGRRPVKSPEQRGARLATEEELEALQVHAPPGAAVPVLVLVNIFTDEDGRPIEVWEDVYAPGMWQIDTE